MAKTIDNLGVEASNRLAQDWALRDEDLIRGGYEVFSHARVETTSPHYPSEFNALFDLDDANVPWIQFSPPKNYHVSQRRLFAEQLIPSLGSSEKQEAQLVRLEAYGNHEEEKHPEAPETIVREKEALKNLFIQLSDLNRDIVDINHGRIQYQKG